MSVCESVFGSVRVSVRTCVSLWGSVSVTVRVSLRVCGDLCWCLCVLRACKHPCAGLLGSVWDCTGLCYSVSVCAYLGWPGIEDVRLWEGPCEGD